MINNSEIENFNLLFKKFFKGSFFLFDSLDPKIDIQLFSQLFLTTLYSRSFIGDPQCRGDGESAEDRKLFVGREEQVEPGGGQKTVAPEMPTFGEMPTRFANMRKSSNWVSVDLISMTAKL